MYERLHKELERRKASTSSSSVEAPPKVTKLELRKMELAIQKHRREEQELQDKFKRNMLAMIAEKEKARKEASQNHKLLAVLNIVEQWNDNRTNIRKEDSDTDDDRESLEDNGMFPNGKVSTEIARQAYNVLDDAFYDDEARYFLDLFKVPNDQTYSHDKH